MKNANEIVLYQAQNQLQRIEVRVENETVWLNRNQIASLFDRDVKTIGKHINNALKEELQEFSTVANFATVQKEGNRTVTRQIEYYNLDVIISVGYRVKSKQGVQFRIWANSILKDYLLKGYTLNNRMNRIEDNLHQLSEKVSSIDFQINTNQLPKQGIFFNGQVFDAYIFVADLIKTAKKDLVLIDNYIDETTLLLFSKRNKNVNCTIYTQKISKVLQQDLEKHNAQYPKITLNTFKKAHDRFLIIDQKTVYHIGASLKDVGKKWFAFSKMEMPAKTILNNLI